MSPEVFRSERESAKSLATRRMLISVAAELFAERGYVETSMRDIAHRASLTTGALYGHFRNKAELLAEAISTRISEEFDHDRPDSLDNRSMRASLKALRPDFDAQYAAADGNAFLPARLLMLMMNPPPRRRISGIATWHA